MSFTYKPRFSTKVASYKTPSVIVALPQAAQIKAKLQRQLSRIPIVRAVFKRRSHAPTPVVVRPGILKRQESAECKSVRFADDTKAFDAVDDPSMNLARPRGERKLPGFPAPGTAAFAAAQLSGRYESCFSSVNCRRKLMRAMSAPGPAQPSRPSPVRASSYPSGSRAATPASSLSPRLEFPLPNSRRVALQQGAATAIHRPTDQAAALSSAAVLYALHTRLECHLTHWLMCLALFLHYYVVKF